MRRRMILLLAAAALGCDGQDTIDPHDRVIATGTYAYEGRWLHPVQMEWDTVRGELTLDAATPDSLHGHWAVAGYGSDSTGGYWNENAYVIQSRHNGGLITLTHRVWRVGSPAEVECTLAYSQATPSGEPIVTSGACELDRN